MRGQWIRYAYARTHGNECLVVFNVYGGSTTLEVLHVLEDGDATDVFFVGSMYAKRLPVGTLVLPIEAVDRAGIVLLDDPAETVVRPRATHVDFIRETLKSSGIAYKEGRIVSVPSVLHDIGHVKEFIEKEEDIDGVEMEVSTFYHFSKKLGLKSYALLYVSDNPRYDVISRAREVREARREALRKATAVALETIAQ